MNSTALSPKSNHKTLSFVIAVSLVIHTAAVFWLHGMSLEFTSSPRSMMERHLPQSQDLDIAEEEDIILRNEQLAEIFKKILTPISEDTTASLTFDMQKMPALIPQDVLSMATFSIDLSAVEKDNNSLTQTDIDHKISAFNEEKELESPNITHELPQHEAFEDVFATGNEGLADELTQMAEKWQKQLTSEPVTDLASADLAFSNPLDPTLFSEIVHSEGGQVIADTATEEPGLLAIGGSGDFKGESAGTNSGLQRGNESLSGFPSLLMREQFPAKPHAGAQTNPKKAANIASSDDFMLLVDYVPKQNGPGYLFRLQLTPKENAVFKRIAHNVFFLVDRSFSIPSERYEKSKRAILQSLSLLQEGDTFNLLVFDSNIVRMSGNNVPFNSQNVSKAYEFFSQQGHGGFFATTDLYSSLGNIVPAIVAEQEVNTAILLSDGDPFLDLSKQRIAIGQWTRQNAGKVSLYSIAASQGNNLSLLGLLSAVNKGELHYAANDDGIAGTIFNLLQGLQHPIGKEITTTVVVPNAGTQVSLFPTSHRLPNLYQDIPYVIYGSTNTLEDFHIFFQGKYYDRWLDIKQVVSFKNVQATSGNTLEHLWTLQKAYDYYDQYLYNGDVAVLKLARQLLHDQGIPIPF
jgi:hypothetical protein